MSFTEDIKNELCRTQLTDSCCASAVCLGILLYANRFAVDRIRLVSSSHEVRKRAQILFGALFGCELEIEGRDNALVIYDTDMIRRIYDWYGFQYKSSALSLNRAVVEEDCCKASFLRGCFLMGGYATAGKKGYHLELVTSHYNVSKQVATLLGEMQLEPGMVVRRGNYVLYYKNSELIETFLTSIGASGGAMDLMLKKVEKSLVNKINRSVNCETANLGKVVDAAARQIDAIERTERAGKFDTLSADLKETARLRREHSMASLSELAAMFDPPISKPSVITRLRRLIKISEELEQ